MSKVEVEPAVAPHGGGGGGAAMAAAVAAATVKVANDSCTNDDRETIVMGTVSRAQIR